MVGASKERRNWTQQELLAAFYVYAVEPFGRLHKGNPLIIDIAEKIGRTPSAVAMKACNFASLDPTHAKRGVSGLSNTSGADQIFWNEYSEDPEKVSDQAIEVLDKYGVEVEQFSKLDKSTQETETVATVTVRRSQQFFRRVVLISYNNRCAISGLKLPELLNASHIIPWRKSREHRVDPRNGIALNALYDRAFDRGLITFDEDFSVRLSSRVPRDAPLMDIANMKLRLPNRWRPLPEFMEYHRENVFIE